MLVSNAPHCASPVSQPFAGALVQRLALLDHVAYGMYGFFNWGLRIRAVSVRQVDKVKAHAFERAINGLHQVFAVKSTFTVDGDLFGIRLG